ncbi:YqgQ family protein [Lapidilactobacillus mulanensis]|uniref:YqgQ family protein n=1 Tax=Lapidilactobacillus mulanensis TaxID=2485999 RepID=A0ABW4DNT2_9LACO|nr:YqgQ family protein [Lapidilactobacillus mulanensis]
MVNSEPQFRHYYDVEQLLKRFGIYVYMGKRLWDIEMTGVELQKLHDSGLITDTIYAHAKIVLRHEHELEIKRSNKSKEDQ